MKETIGLIGLGSMGQPMARNLVQSGYSLRIYNRTPGKASQIRELGATPVFTLADVALPGGVVVSMVSDDDALEEVSTADDALAIRLGEGGIHLSMSTVSPAVARRVAEHHRRFGVDYVAAPVFGRPEAASAGKLWICIAGAPTAKKRVQPVLQALGQGIFDVGEEPGAANVIKLVGNFFISSAVEAMAEGLAFGEKNGVEPETIINIMGQTLFACTIYQNYGKALIQAKYEPPGFRLKLGLKDIDLILKTAASNLTPMPFASLLHDRLLASVAKGRGHLDWVALGLSVAEDAGLKRSP